MLDLPTEERAPATNTVPSMLQRTIPLSGKSNIHLSVALGHTLQLVLLLDGVAVAATLGGVDEFFCQALGNALDVAEGGLAGTDGEESDGLVDTAEGGDIDGLATDGTGASDTCAVFAGTAVDNGVDGDLDGVLVGHDVDLKECVSRSNCVARQGRVAI